MQTYEGQPSELTSQHGIAMRRSRAALFETPAQAAAMQDGTKESGRVLRDKGSAPARQRHTFLLYRARSAVSLPIFSKMSLMNEFMIDTAVQTGSLVGSGF